MQLICTNPRLPKPCQDQEPKLPCLNPCWEKDIGLTASPCQSNSQPQAGLTAPCWIDRQLEADQTVLSQTVEPALWKNINRLLTPSLTTLSWSECANATGQTAHDLIHLNHMTTFLGRSHHPKPESLNFQQIKLQLDKWSQLMFIIFMMRPSHMAIQYQQE